MYCKKLYVIFLFLFISLFLAVNLCAFEGKVVSVTDGDTITVMHDEVPENVRVNGVDCPEIGQPFGEKAKAFTSTMLLEESVTIKMQGRDKDGRIIGDVLFSDGKNLGKELVKAGLAWWYQQYSKSKELKQLEQEAKLSKKGLWAENNPLPPWDWRDKTENEIIVGVSQNSSLPSDNLVTTPYKKNTAINATQDNILTEQESSAEATVYVTKTGSKYHRAGCHYLKSSIPSTLSVASTHYSPCSVCNPPTLSSSATSINPTNNYSNPKNTGTPTGETTPTGYQIYTGPRGGRFHYSKNGNKVYERKRK